MSPCISVLYFIPSPFVGLHTFFSPSVHGCQMSMGMFSSLWESPKAYPNLPHPLKPNASPLDMWPPCLFWNLHWLPSSLRERLAPDLWKWTLSHTDPFRYSLSRCWLNTHSVSHYSRWGAKLGDKTSKTFCLHRVYIPVHAASPALWTLVPEESWFCPGSSILWGSKGAGWQWPLPA